MLGHAKGIKSRARWRAPVSRLCREFLILSPLRGRASQPYRGRSAMDGAESGARQDVDRRDPDRVRSTGHPAQRAGPKPKKKPYLGANPSQALDRCSSLAHRFLALSRVERRAARPCAALTIQLVARFGERVSPCPSSYIVAIINMASSLSWVVGGPPSSCSMVRSNQERALV